MFTSTPKAVAVMTVDCLTRFWGVGVALRNLRITWDAQRMYFATNSFHVL
jgi:hypothetical protein